MITAHNNSTIMQQPEASSKSCIEIVPGSFQSVKHFYPKTIGTTVSDVVRDFMEMGKSFESSF